MLVITYNWGWWDWLIPVLERGFRLWVAVESMEERLRNRVKRWMLDALCAYFLPKLRPLPGVSLEKRPSGLCLA